MRCKQASVIPPPPQKKNILFSSHQQINMSAVQLVITILLLDKD